MKLDGERFPQYSLRSSPENYIGTSAKKANIVAHDIETIVQSSYNKKGKDQILSLPFAP